MVYDKVHVVDLGFVDLPNVVTDESGSIQICGSTKWRGLRNLSGIFTCILSHESLHLALIRIDEATSEELDNVASFSTISTSLREIPACSRYPHGLIGIEATIEDQKK